MLKKSLIIVLITIAIPLLVAVFVQKDYSVGREIIINKPKQAVFDYMKYLKNQDKYSKMGNDGSGNEKNLPGTDGTVGELSHEPDDAFYAL